MTAGLELDAASEWLFDTLGHDFALNRMGVTGPYDSLMPQNTSLPTIVIQLMASTDVMVVGAYRIFTNALFLVKVVAQTEWYSSLAPIVARVDELLHRANGGITVDGQTWGCLREQPFRLAEFTAGVNYRSAGGLYRLFVT